MDTRTHFGLPLAFVAVLAALGAAPAAAQASAAATPAPATPAPATPAPATPAVIAQGDSIFHGKGNCYACHGAGAQGAVGPNLTDAEWIHSDGSYDAIVKQVTTGVAKEESKSRIPDAGQGRLDHLR